MSDLIKRVISSIILLPLVFYFILKGSFYLIFLIVICFSIASYEWHKMVKHKLYRILGYIFLIFLFTHFMNYQLKSL